MRTRGEDESIKLNYGSLYTVVESLARRGLIEPSEPERDGRRPERTVYTITPAGHAEFVDWLTDLLATPVKEYPQFEAGLTLMCGLPAGDVLPLLEERCMKLELELGRLSSMLDVVTRDGVPRVFLVEVSTSARCVRQSSSSPAPWHATSSRARSTGSTNGRRSTRLAMTPRRPMRQTVRRQP